MGPVVVAADQFADRAVEAGEIEDRHWCPAVGPEVAGERGEEFGVDGAEEPFDLAAPLGPADGRVDDPDEQGDGGLLEVVADEVRAVVDTQNFGDAAHLPTRGQSFARSPAGERERC